MKLNHSLVSLHTSSNLWNAKLLVSTHTHHYKQYSASVWVKTWHLMLNSKGILNLTNKLGWYFGYEDNKAVHIPAGIPPNMITCPLPVLLLCAVIIIRQRQNRFKTTGGHMTLFTKTCFKFPSMFGFRHYSK